MHELKISTEALKDLLFRLADDDLVIGHRNSEWTGMGPVLEEDIAFSSMAQDEVGHAQAYYQLLHELGEAAPDDLAFARPAAEFRCAQLVELPIQDYAYSLVRHWLYDTAESVRLEALKHSHYRPLAELAGKLLREERYHLMHARTWILQLGQANADSNARLQAALDVAYAQAWSLFETGPYEQELAEHHIQPLESVLAVRWQQQVQALAQEAGLALHPSPESSFWMGGRHGQHTDHLHQLLDEMQVVFRIDAQAKW